MLYLILSYQCVICGPSPISKESSEKVQVLVLVLSRQVAGQIKNVILCPWLAVLCLKSQISVIARDSWRMVQSWVVHWFQWKDEEVLHMQTQWKQPAANTAKLPWYKPTWYSELPPPALSGCSQLPPADRLCKDTCLPSDDWQPHCLLSVAISTWNNPKNLRTQEGNDNLSFWGSLVRGPLESGFRSENWIWGVPY